MDKDKLFSDMQEIEFVLFSIKTNSNIHAEEIENAHKKAQEIIKELVK